MIVKVAGIYFILFILWVWGLLSKGLSWKEKMNRSRVLTCHPRGVPLPAPLQLVSLDEAGARAMLRTPRCGTLLGDTVGANSVPSQQDPALSRGTSVPNTPVLRGAA